ncbi:MAG TPA: hypothetical protein VMV86_05590 [Methanosarcinales archaeon]|nr:hypothetical protein [Methanosarcinales archaeon]
MNPLILILAVVIIIANVTSDEIKSKWSCIFGFWFPKGSKGEQWFNPSLSWQNKYKKTKFWTFVFSTALVMFTDFWHLLKFIIISCVVSAYLIKTGVNSFGEFVMWLLSAHLVWGILYEGFTGVFASLGDDKVLRKALSYPKVKWYIFSIFAVLVVIGIVLQLFEKSVFVPTIIYGSTLIIWFVLSLKNRNNGSN